MLSLDVRQNFGTLLEQKTDDKSRNPLHVAAAVGFNGVIEHIVRFVLEAIPGQDLYFYCSAIEAKDIEGNTAVDIALSTGCEELALYFLSMIPSSCDYIFKAIDKQFHSVVKFILDEIHEGGWADDLHMGKQNLLHIASKCTVAVDPQLKIIYIQSRRDVTQMGETISLVAALLATGFTLPGGFDGDSGDAILTKKATFLVFLIADTYATCCSMLILFSIIWSMVYDSKKSSFLADRSLGLLKHSLYGTFLAFMTGVYTVTYNKSLWIAIVVIIMCSLAVLLAPRLIFIRCLNSQTP